MLDIDYEYIKNHIDYNELKGKTILVTGAYGFIASNIIEFILMLNMEYEELNCKVIALCKSKEKAQLRFKDYLDSENLIIYEGNVEEMIVYDKPIHFIIHAAGIAQTNKFTQYPVEVIKANVIGTNNLLELAREKASESFLFFSSGAVYGQVPDGVLSIDENMYYPISFDHIANCYSEGKRCGELLCNSYWNEYQVPAKSVRISHTYGPGIDIYDGRVFSDFINNIINNQNLLIRGSGRDVRPYCYITDAIIGFFMILFYGKNGDCYNLANSKQTLSVYELATSLVKDVFPEKNLRVDAPNLVRAEAKKVLVNTQKLEKLGWSPEIDIRIGFKRTADYYTGKNNV